MAVVLVDGRRERLRGSRQPRAVQPVANVAVPAEAEAEAEAEAPVVKPIFTLDKLQACIEKCSPYQRINISRDILAPFLEKEASVLRHMAGTPQVVMTAQFVCYLKTLHGDAVCNPPSRMQNSLFSLLQRVEMRKGGSE